MGTLSRSSSHLGLSRARPGDPAGVPDVARASLRSVACWLGRAEDPPRAQSYKKPRRLPRTASLCLRGDHFWGRLLQPDGGPSALTAGYVRRSLSPPPGPRRCGAHAQDQKVQTTEPGCREDKPTRRSGLREPLLRGGDHGTATAVPVTNAPACDSAPRRREGLSGRDGPTGRGSARLRVSLAAPRVSAPRFFVLLTCRLTS